MGSILSMWPADVDFKTTSSFLVAIAIAVAKAGGIGNRRRDRLPSDNCLLLRTGAGSKVEAGRLVRVLLKACGGNRIDVWK